MVNLYNYLKLRFGGLREESGQTIVEYVLMLVLVALAVAAASPSVTSAILGVFTATSTALTPPTAS